jgi:hypothetical protein
LCGLQKNLNFMGNEPRLAMGQAEVATPEQPPGQSLPAEARAEVSAVTSFISPLLGSKRRF